MKTAKLIKLEATYAFQGERMMVVANGDEVVIKFSKQALELIPYTEETLEALMDFRKRLNLEKVRLSKRSTFRGKRMVR